MKKLLIVALGVLLLAGASASRGHSPSPEVTAGSISLLEFDKMAAIPAVLAGKTDPLLRNVPGGGLPWMIGMGKGELKSDGKLEVTVRGLVLAKMSPVPANLRGINPIDHFQAVVSCISLNASGASTIVNVRTDSFPATTTGNADIEAKVKLPSPCFAPVIFVTSPAAPLAPTGRWFAVTGQMP